MIRSLTAVASIAALLGVTACASTDSAPATAAAPSAAPAAAPMPAAPNPAIAMGGELFTARCSGCHSGTGRPPARDALAKMTSDYIVMSLTTGKMSAQGRTLTDDDKKNVATFLTRG